jgi:hypothetical protein
MKLFISIVVIAIGVLGVRSSTQQTKVLPSCMQKYLNTKPGIWKEFEKASNMFDNNNITCQEATVNARHLVACIAHAPCTNLEKIFACNCIINRFRNETLTPCELKGCVLPSLFKSIFPKNILESHDCYKPDTPSLNIAYENAIDKIVMSAYRKHDPTAFKQTVAHSAIDNFLQYLIDSNKCLNTEKQQICNKIQSEYVFKGYNGTATHNCDPFGKSP